MVLDALAAGAQLATSAAEIVDRMGLFRPTEVTLGMLGSAQGAWDGSRAVFRLRLDTTVAYDRSRRPSVLVLMRGGPRGLVDDAPTWSTRVRLGGRYLFHVPPGTYAVAALYIAAHVHPRMVPDLLAVGEVPLRELVIGDRPTIAVPGLAPSHAHVTALERAPEAQKLFRVQPPVVPSRPGYRSISPAGGSGPLLQCRAKVAGAPNGRCTGTNRGEAVCARHRGTNAVDFQTDDPLAAGPGPEGQVRALRPSSHPTAVMPAAIGVAGVGSARSSIAPPGPGRQLAAGVNGFVPLYQCVATDIGAPNGRCTGTSRGETRCARHR